LVFRGFSNSAIKELADSLLWVIQSLKLGQLGLTGVAVVFEQRFDKQRSLAAEGVVKTATIDTCSFDVEISCIRIRLMKNKRISAIIPLY